VKKRLLLGVGLVCVVAAIAFACWLVMSVGWERADKISAVSSAVIGVVGLVLTAFGIVSKPGGKTAQTVKGTKVGGGVKQKSPNAAEQLIDKSDIKGSVDQESGAAGNTGP
jgi:hypothetical protein